MKAVKRVFLGILILFALGLGAGVGWLYSSLPETSGEVRLSGISAPVEIVRDSNGVPYIYAENERDARFALGYAHAQDRLWQMEAQRRFGAGRLAEFAGRAALPTDRFMRTLGLYRRAESAFAALPADVRQAFEDYAAGVNAWITDHSGALPPEFIATGLKPELWKPADSLVWFKLMALRLSGNFRDEALRYRLTRRLKPTEIAEMWPDYPPEGPVSLAALGSPPMDLAGAWPWPDGMPRGASNAWVVGGTLSESGKPLLANDPHLGFAAPILWYLVHVEAGGRTLAGASVPGVPFLLLGHNDRVAWGLTATQSDTQDLFIERPSAGVPDAYDTPSGPRQFVQRRERIAVKGEPDVIHVVRETRHGPVLYNAAGGGDGSVPGAVMALSATFLAKTDSTAAALYKLNRAENSDDVVAALADLVAPQLNVVFADVDGAIGFYAAGHVPIRGAGNGLVPQPGWTGEFDWRKVIPFNELPHVVNPADRKIVNANNKVIDGDYPYFITIDWAPPYRAERILERLDGAGKYALDDFAMIQQDDRSDMVRALLPLMTKDVAVDGRAGAALAMLKAWDGSMSRQRPEPLIFAAWLRAFNRALYADELGSDFGAYFGYRPLFVKSVLTEYPAWCDDRQTEKRESCQDILAAALGKAVAELAGQYGADMKSWKWGDAHVARFANRVFEAVPVIGRFAQLTIPSDGGDFTVNRAATRIGDPVHPFNDIHGPGFRALYDFADLDKSRFIIATGQSGNPLSGHYGDLMERWRDGKYVTLGRTRAELEQAGASVLTLRPR